MTLVTFISYEDIQTTTPLNVKVLTDFMENIISRDNEPLFNQLVGFIEKRIAVVGSMYVQVMMKHVFNEPYFNNRRVLTIIH